MATSVSEAIPEFADAFAFEEFNRMQAAALPAVLKRDANVVVSAPTASGKTALAELAICRTLGNGGTALFLAPMRALTNEKESEWERFEALGYSVYVVTGERDLNPRRARRADILVMTPEKADSATRKHDTRRYEFVTDVDCCVIDEVHLLDSDKRGSVLEVTIARLRRLCDPRIVALSATMQNAADVAEWLDAPEEATFAFGEEYRPVPLHSSVEIYTHGDNAFADKYRRLYRALDLAQPHIEDDGQALVFVSSRQDTVQAAKKATEELDDRDVAVGGRGEYDWHTETEELQNKTLRQSVLDGVAFHHAGLSKNDKDLVEGWFREGHVRLLFSTSTLAWGVNLPARCVVIRDTNYHDPLEGEVDMSPLDVLQMLGRAGRPGYDDAGYAHVVCDARDAPKYSTLLEEGKPIESRLAEDLAAHMNAEIALGTVGDLADAMDWLETTFYYVRAQSAPERYESGGRLRERARTTLDDLVERGFVEREVDEAGVDEAGVDEAGVDEAGVDEAGVDEAVKNRGLSATKLGRLTSKFYLRLETAEAFRTLADRAEGATVDEDDVLRVVSDAAEFDSVSARQSEREAVRAVLDGDAEDLDAGNRKVFAILRAGMTGSTPGELHSDAWVIRQNALRLLAALRAFLSEFADARAANLAHRVSSRVEHGVSADAVGLTAIDGVGAGRAQKLSAEGLTSPADVREAGVDGLVEAGLSEGLAERVLESAGDLPDAEVRWGEFPERIPRGENEMTEVEILTESGGARAGVCVSVNGVEMTTWSGFLGEAAVPVGVFGGDAEELEFAVTVSFSELPIEPRRETRTVRIE